MMGGEIEQKVSRGVVVRCAVEVLKAKCVW
jgi:hypothetical protein